MAPRKKSPVIIAGNCDQCGAPILCRQDILDNLEAYTREGEDGQPEAMVAIFTCRCRLNRITQPAPVQQLGQHVYWPGAATGTQIRLDDSPLVLPEGYSPFNGPYVYDPTQPDMTFTTTTVGEDGTPYTPIYMGLLGGVTDGAS